MVISYDSDGAGQAATLRGLEILKNVGCDVRILQMEGAKDPDEYVIKYGNGRFNLLVENAISLIEFKVKVLKKNLDLTNVNDKIKFLKETAKLITTISSKIEQEIYIDKIANEYKISKEALYAEINKTNDKIVTTKVLERKPRQVIKKENIDKKLIDREKAIIALLIQEKKLWQKIEQEIKLDDFKSEINKKILKKLYEEYEKGNSNINNVLNYFIDDEETMSRLTEIMADEYQIDNDEKAIRNVINTYKIDKNIKLATYASRCISNEILMHIRKNKKSKNDVSLDDTLNYDAEGNELKLSDVVGTEEDIVDRQFQDKMNREFLANEINNLSKRDKEIMMLRYGLNNTKEYTQKEVANMLGISQSYISRIEKKVINEISKVIN